MYLVDTNIFLEILLQQKRSQDCKDFLHNNTGELNLTDFSIHSIGVILFRENEDNLFSKFLTDTLPKVHLISLPKSQYKEVIQNRKKLKLDFDDAYQYSVCKHYGFKLTTMDQDFKNVKDIEICVFIIYKKHDRLDLIRFLEHGANLRDNRKVQRR